MLFIAIVPFSKRPEVQCYGRIALDAAHRALDRGDRFACACWCREAIRRYLFAWCQAHSLPVRSKYLSPRKLYRQLKTAGVECCSWVLEVVDACNQIAHCEPAKVSLDCCLEIVEAVFGGDFDRVEGEL